MPPLVDGEEQTFPQIPEQVPVIVEVIKPPKYSGIANDTKFNAASTLLTHVEGSSWTVTYYSQILTKDSALSGQQVTTSSLYQQYMKISDMEIKVTNPITYSQDDVTKSIKGIGGGNIYPFLIPNVGDMFIADLGDGNLGLFRVTLSERKSVFKETVHAIEYTLIQTSASSLQFSTFVDDLESKVVDTVKFVRDFIRHGQNPLLHLEEFELMRNLGDYYASIMHTYFKSFISNEFKTLLIPGQDYPTYDHYLTSSIMSSFTTYDDPEVRNIKLFAVSDDPLMKATNIWDMLKQRDIRLFKYCFKRAGLVSTASFTSNAMLEGIKYSGVKLVVYPIDPQVNVNFEHLSLMKPIYENALQETVSAIVNLSDLIADNEFEGLTLPDCPLIHKVMVDDYYVLSEAFYNKDNANMSILEHCVMRYLNGEAPNIKELLALCSASHSWNRLEQYYYTAVLLILVRAAVRYI